MAYLLYIPVSIHEGSTPPLPNREYCGLVSPFLAVIDPISFSLVYPFTDYNAPITENGGYTEKYNKAAEMISAYDTLSDILMKPERPDYVAPTIYPDVQVSEMLSFQQILDQVVRH